MATRRSPEFSMATASSIERPVSGLSLFRFSQQSQPYFSVMPTVQTATRPLSFGLPKTVLSFD